MGVRNLYKYMEKHENIIFNSLNSTEEKDWTYLAQYHKAQIEFMQHERLIHLMVTLAFAMFCITSYIITFFMTTLPLLLLDVVLTVMLIFYIIHYYRLENRVQKWYGLYNKICEKML